MPDLAVVMDIWSNIAYVVASIVCLNYISKSGTSNNLTKFFSGLIFCIAIGSSIYHTFGTPLAKLSDVIPCWTFMLTYISAGLYYMLGISKWRTAFYMLIYIIALAVTGTFHIEAPAVPWIPAGVMLWILSIGLYNRGKQSYYSIGVGAVCFTVGLTLKTINPWASAYITMGTHWLWHIVTATMLVYLTTGMHDCFLAAEKKKKSLDGLVEAPNGI